MDWLIDICGRDLLVTGSSTPCRWHRHRDVCGLSRFGINQCIAVESLPGMRVTLFDDILAYCSLPLTSSRVTHYIASIQQQKNIYVRTNLSRFTSILVYCYWGFVSTCRYWKTYRPSWQWQPMIKYRSVDGYSCF